MLLLDFAIGSMQADPDQVGDEAPRSPRGDAPPRPINSAITLPDIGGGRGPVILQGGVLIDRQSQGGQWAGVGGLGQRRVDAGDLGAQIA